MDLEKGPGISYSEMDHTSSEMDLDRSSDTDITFVVRGTTRKRTLVENPPKALKVGIESQTCEMITKRFYKPKSDNERICGSSIILVPLLLSHPGLGTRQWRSYHPSTFNGDVDILLQDIPNLQGTSGGLHFLTKAVSVI